MKKQTKVLLILDGYGLNDNCDHNAVCMGKTPNMDRIMDQYPWQKGYASGMAVGLPDGQMGNSEVGHLNIGAGRVVYQELTRITKSIRDGDFFENPTFLKAVRNCKENDSALHLFGLLSDGGVHSHNTHIYAMLELAKKQGLTKVYVHPFLDGRDTPPASGKSFVQALQDKIDEIGVGEIATVSGRYYAMDRDNRWERMTFAYDALVGGKGQVANDAITAVSNSYEQEVYDEFMLPTVIMKDGQPVAKVCDNDSVVFCNFRPDRARQLTRMFCDFEFDAVPRERKNVTFATFTQYDITIPNTDVAYTPQKLDNTLGQYLAANNKTQIRTAETEKYAHVTFFFNGGVEEPNEGETRILVPSPKVATYDMQPEMSIFEVADQLTTAIRAGETDLIVANFANADMVGHSGLLEAAVSAIEAVDKAVGQVYDAVLEIGGAMFICADHGNAEQMIDYNNNEPFTAHTINPVPFILVNYDKDYILREGGKLADIAPTLLEMMGMSKPPEMTGESLLLKK
ncbi:MAG TPA: 2,3-bisphosphoglycerate-independent phosphoglycerate mutase [Epulopiscium sp.]|nr:2,3-bisphosphoglycerate-independent phosphoglycerate mutase [Candidatus Epulonipiscium sp.]